MKIYNTSQNSLIADDAKVAKSFITRSIGLLFRKSMSEDEALIIKPCCSIHTLFMKFDIDVIFVSRKNKVIAVYENVAPSRILPIHFNSYYVIELKAGTISAKTIEKGDTLKIDY